MVKLHQPDGRTLTVNAEQGHVFLGEVQDRAIYETKMPPQTAVILGQALIDAGRKVNGGSQPLEMLPAFIVVFAGALILCALLW